MPQQTTSRDATPARVRDLILLGILVVAVYSGVLRHEFLVLDDRPLVVENPQVQQGLAVDGIDWAFTTRLGATWQPLVWVSYMADRSLYGPGPAGFHLTNLLLHLAATLLLYVALRRMLPGRGVSLLVAALYAVHPVQVESVAWVAERKGLVAAVFWMLGLLVYVSGGRVRSWRNRLGVFCCMAFGLLAKSSLLTLPFALLLLDFWPRGTLAVGDRTAWARALREKIELFALVPVFVSVGYAAQAGAGAVREAGADRLSHIVFAYAVYLRELVLPVQLESVRPVPVGGVSAGAVLLAAAVLVGVTIAAVRGRRRFPAGLTGWFWYLGNLVPFVGFVAVGTHFVADRYLLLPSIGVFLVVALGGRSLLDRARLPSWVVTGSAVALVLVLGLLSVRQVGFWKDSKTLFTRAVAVDADNYLAEYWLGETLAREDAHAAAAEHFARARTIHPGYDLAWFGEGNSQLALGRDAEAAHAFQEYLKLRPRQFKGWMNLGAAFGRGGQFEQALQCFERALEIAPENELARINRDRARQALATRPAPPAQDR